MFFRSILGNEKSYIFTMFLRSSTTLSSLPRTSPRAPINFCQGEKMVSLITSRWWLGKGGLGVEDQNYAWRSHFKWQQEIKRRMVKTSIYMHDILARTIHDSGTKCGKSWISWIWNHLHDHLPGRLPTDSHLLLLLQSVVHLLPL